MQVRRHIDLEQVIIQALGLQDRMVRKLTIIMEVGEAPILEVTEVFVDEPINSDSLRTELRRYRLEPID